MFPQANADAQRANVIEAERELEEAESATSARVALAEANLAASQAEFVRCQTEQQQAETDAKRYPLLVKTGALAEQTSDQQKTKVEVAQASTDAGRKQVLAAEATLNQAKAQLQQIATQKRILRPPGSVEAFRDEHERFADHRPNCWHHPDALCRARQNNRGRPNDSHHG
jgi:multidrug resistance efflux pump